jgi:hypothetical protein
MLRSIVLAFALVLLAPVAHADNTAAVRPSTTMHYPTLEKLLRKFSRQAGEPRTRG